MIDERVPLQEVVDATGFYALLPYLLKNSLSAQPRHARVLLSGIQTSDWQRRRSNRWIPAKNARE